MTFLCGAVDFRTHGKLTTGQTSWWEFLVTQIRVAEGGFFLRLQAISPSR